MKIGYFANIRLPTERAHGIQIMEMCNAFAKNGHDIKLIIPKRLNKIKVDPYKYHDIPKTFEIIRLPCIDLVFLGKIGFYIQSLSFALSSAIYLLFKRFDLVFSRDEYLVYFLMKISKRIIWEAHMGQNNFFVKHLIDQRTKIVCITEGLKDFYIKNEADPDRIVVAPDGADVDRFDIAISREEARLKLNLPLESKIVLYKGSLQKWKGADTLALASKYVKDEKIIFVFIGGTEKDVLNFRNEYGNLKNIIILGNRPRNETPIFQKAADILAIPNSGKEEISKTYTSPMKLFGYMASGVPIVASDLPSIREVLNENTAYFAKPDDSISFANSIDSALHDETGAEEKAKKAFEEVKKYSWLGRAGSILENI